MASGAN
jgi:hypothetical protein